MNNTFSNITIEITSGKKTSFEILSCLVTIGTKQSLLANHFAQISHVEQGKKPPGQNIRRLAFLIILFLLGKVIMSALFINIAIELATTSKYHKYITHH